MIRHLVLFKLNEGVLADECARLLTAFFRDR